jgi:hypothetical protein
MILTPVAAIDAHGRIGPMVHQNSLRDTSTRHTPPHINNSSQNPMQKLCRIVQPPFQLPSAFSPKQINDGHPQNKQKFYRLSHFSPTPSITTIQQLGLGIVHAFSTLILNSYKKLVHSQTSTSPAFDLYDFQYFLVTKSLVYC